jgi:hypothetical protein
MRRSFVNGKTATSWTVDRGPALDPRSYLRTESSIPFASPPDRPTNATARSRVPRVPSPPGTSPSPLLPESSLRSAAELQEHGIMPRRAFTCIAPGAASLLVFSLARRGCVWSAAIFSASAVFFARIALKSFTPGQVLLEVVEVVLGPVWTRVHEDFLIEQRLDVVEMDRVRLLARHPQAEEKHE